jgi:glucose-6-phosphate isomerase
VTAAAYADALARSADGIDPFAQPAVEEGKVLAKRYLTATA